MGVYMSFFKNLFSIQTTNNFHKNLIVISFLVWMAGIAITSLSTELIEILGKSSEPFFNIFRQPAMDVRDTSCVVFIVSYILDKFTN